MKAVILAGGFGSRMGNVCAKVPKPLIEIAGKPILAHQIQALKAQGVKDFIFVVGYLGEKIKEYFLDGGAFGVNISYFFETEPLGTAGALFHLDLKEDFLLLNGDLIFDFCLADMLSFHKKSAAKITLMAHPNDHPFDSTLLLSDKNGLVKEIIPKDNKPFSYSNLCNAGIQLVSPEVFEKTADFKKVDFDRDIVKPLVPKGVVFAYRTSEYVKDMGTPERFAEVENDIKSGFVKAKCRTNKQRAVFVDRDGTLNVLKGFITKPEDIELIKGTESAVRTLNKMGYLVIVVTNQPIIARGDCTKSELSAIHNRLETLLGQGGAFLDAVYYCPHHPDSGFKNEIKELKIKCTCRKPEPGLIFKARDEFNIDLSQSFMVGDTIRDVEAGQNAGCISVLIGGEECEGESEVKKFPSLSAFVKWLKENG